MAVVDVASLGVRIEAEGVDSTQAALRGIEAQGERVSRAVGNLTARVSVTGTDTVAASVRRISETVAGVTTSSAAATRAVTSGAAARSAALAKEAESAERAARRAEEAVQRKDAAVKAAHATEVAAVRAAGGEPAGVDPAVRRASDRAEQALDTAQRKAADLKAVAEQARAAADAAARSVLAEVETRARALGRAVDPMARAAPLTLAAIPRDQSGLLERQPAPVLGAQPVPPRDHNVVGHIPGLDDLGRESADAAAAQAALAKDARAAADALSAEERRIASIVASVEDMATSIDVASSRQVASFRANARAAGEYLETIHAGEQAAERIADAMLNVTTRAAQAAAAPRLPPPSASPSSRPVDDEGGTAAIRRRVAMLEQATRIESTRSEALVRLGGVEAGLARALERTNLTLQQRVTLEQLLARTQTAGRSAPPPSFGTADTGALSRRIALLTQGTQVDATFAESVAKLTGVQGGLEAALRRSNLTLEQRIALGGQLARVEAVLAGAAGGATAQIDRGGNAATAAGSKFRSAANGITAVAFAATAGGGSMQGMALAAGLAASSMAQLSGAAGAVAGGIGAAITVGVALVGVLDQIRQKRQAALLRDAVDPRFTRSSEEARASLGHLDRQADLLRRRITELRETTFQFGAGGFGVEGAFLGPVRAAQRELANVEERARELRRQRAEPLAAEEAEQRRQAVVGGLQAENQAVTAAADARLATERTRYEQGRSDLATYTDARVAAVRAGAAREVAELRAQQRALRDDTGRPADETRAARDTRLAEATQLDAQIRAVRNRAAGEEAAAIAERDAQARALAQRIRGYDQQIAQARGDTHGATMAQIRAEAAEYARTLAQREPAGDDEARRAAQAADVARFVETRTAAAQAAEAQRVLAREQSALGAKRAEIQARVNAGTLTEVEGQRAIAAAERERMPALAAQLAIIERIALALGNPDLLAFVRQMRGELAGLGTALTPLQERMKAVFNDLAAQGSATAAAVSAKISEMIAKAGGAVTPTIAFKAEALARLGASIETQFKSFGMNAADAFASAMGAGIAAFGSGPITFKNFFETMGNSLLSGLGNIFTQMGSQLIVYGAIMSGLLPFLTNPFTSGPAAIAAGVALVATGATLGAIATKNSKGGGGGGGGSVSAPASFDQSASVILTPRAAGKAPQPQPIVQIGSVQILNPNDPSWQRQLSESVQGGVRRGLKFGMAGT